MRKISEKKRFGFGKKNFGSETDTGIGPWFRFPIPKPNFGLTLSQMRLQKFSALIFGFVKSCPRSFLRTSEEVGDNFKTTLTKLFKIVFHRLLTQNKRGTEEALNNLNWGTGLFNPRT
jgi:hypothetical protein